MDDRTILESSLRSAQSLMDQLNRRTGDDASLIRLPAYLWSLRYKISEQANIREAFFLFDNPGLPESVMIYYPRSGEDDDAERDEPCCTSEPVLLVREYGNVTIGLFKSVSEAVAALAMTTLGLGFTFDSQESVNRLAASFLEFCIEHRMVAQRYNQEAAERELHDLRRAIEMDERLISTQA